MYISPKFEIKLPDNEPERIVGFEPDICNEPDTLTEPVTPIEPVICAEPLKGKPTPVPPPPNDEVGTDIEMLPAPPTNACPCCREAVREPVTITSPVTLTSAACIVTPPFVTNSDIVGVVNTPPLTINPLPLTNVGNVESNIILLDVNCNLISPEPDELISFTNNVVCIDCCDTKLLEPVVAYEPVLEFKLPVVLLTDAVNAFVDAVYAPKIVSFTASIALIVAAVDAEYAKNEEVNNFSLILFCSVDDDAFNSAADTKFKSTEELNNSNASIDDDRD